MSLPLPPQEVGQFISDLDDIPQALVRLVLCGHVLAQRVVGPRAATDGQHGREKH